MKSVLFLSAISMLTTACQAQQVGGGPDAPFKTEVMGTFSKPWAMTFLPDGKSALITEKRGKLLLWEPGGKSISVSGVPKVAYGGQGGMGDVVLAPDFEANNIVYLSWVEGGADKTYGSVVGMAKLMRNPDGTAALSDMKIIWQHSPKVTGQGHYSQRMAFSPDGKYLFIGSGERQKFDPAQNMDMNLGKVLRLFPDGSIPTDNPFFTEGNPIRSQIWSLGHRNILGLAFDDAGQLWNQEMGPQGGDELNLVSPTKNYGYPIVSNGDHYDDRDIPDHKPGDGFEAPKVFWNPVISPAGLAYYNGDMFPDWKGSLFIGGLSSEAVIRVKVNGKAAAKADQWQMGNRIREIEQGPDGALWVMEDGDNARLMKLTPR
jgi:aldose sugar dehydrogenase